MAAPLGHVACALALFNTISGPILDKNAFIRGTSFPDIRYIADVNRSQTHNLAEGNLNFVLQGSSFEQGRKFHVFVDIKRAAYMRALKAHRFIPKGPLQTQMLKIIEDHILAQNNIKKIEIKNIFNTPSEEELKYGVSFQAVSNWHNILKSYLDLDTYFSSWRYLRTMVLFQRAYDFEGNLLSYAWRRMRTFGFLIYAYYQVEKLSRNPELKKIILDFYHVKFPQIIKEELGKVEKPQEMVRKINLYLNNRQGILSYFLANI